MEFLYLRERCRFGLMIHGRYGSKKLTGVHVMDLVA